jgi:hypothetical protein
MPVASAMLAQPECVSIAAKLFRQSFALLDGLAGPKRKRRHFLQG